MKKTLILASLAFMLNATFGAAMTTSQAKDKKEKTEKVKKDKKSKKSKGDKANAELVVTKPELKGAADSIAYVFGAYQSNGLLAYMQQQLNVDTAYISDFAKGILDRSNVDPADKKQHAYYAGLQIGSQIESMSQGLSKDYYAADPGKTVDHKIIANAIVASLLGKCEISSDSAQKVFSTAIKARQEANKEAMYGANREAGERYLAENKQKEGVVTLPSGLQYKVLTMGTGDKPKADDKVKVNYEGRLVDGTVFDSSYKRNKPSTFKCNQVIKGWTEALQLMPVGSKWEVYIPYDLAYGDREVGDKIKPYSALVFTVDLVEIEDEKADSTKTTAAKSTAKAAKSTAKAGKSASK